jgi:DNA helicase-2/ATP-dependent DNA helicase PcrA
MLELGQRFAQGHQSEIKHVLVDEYQDMDVAQANLLVAICKNVKTLRIFGDPGQAIYSFMGTQVEDIAALLNVKIATLSTSLRLTHQTAALASSILNSHRIDGSHDGPKPVLKRCRSQQGQERYVVDLVRTLSAQGVPPDRVAVLARTRNELRLVERVLRSHRVAVNPMHRETQRDHLLSMLELLRLVNANKKELRQSLSKARRTAFASRFLEIFGPIPDTHVFGVTRTLLAAARAGSLEGRFNAVKRGYLLALRKSRQGHARTSVEHELNLWQPLIREHKSVRSFKEFVERQHGQFGVTLSTIHSAKGKEWDHVIVINATDGAIPHIREIHKQNIEEERRLLYVATTRARQHLHLVQAPVFRGPARHSQRSRLLSARTLCHCDFHLNAEIST